jgi:hypothetical protein
VEQQVLRRIIEQLKQEHAQVLYAIRALEALASGKRRRGRPPKFIGEPRETPGRARQE